MTVRKSNKILLLGAMAVCSMIAWQPPAGAQTPFTTSPSQRDDLFPRPPDLEPTVGFWKRVFTEWSQDEIVFHDRDNVDIVYRAMRQEKAEDTRTAKANERVQKAVVARIRTILLDLAARNPDPRTLSGEYRAVYEAFGSIGGPERWRQAADRIRIQRGLSDRFREGLVKAGLYRDHILAVLEEEGVPREIAWLPMVESTFNVAARSSVGATGVWQFMRSTARLYMRADRTVDERLDPITAARGAARLLKYNYRGLGNWPLALTAYNHGYYGMRRAVRQLGTNDYMTIRRHYDGRAFGFASKNFYAEFLAAVDVAENAWMYFGDVEPLPPIEFDEVVVPISMSLTAVATALQVEPEELAELNLALTNAVRRGRRSVPAGYLLRVPVEIGETGQEQLASAAAAKTGQPVRTVEPGAERYYTVQRGDTLSLIAVRHGTTVRELVRLNELDDEDQIRVGQRLKVSG